MNESEASRYRATQKGFWDEYRIEPSHPTLPMPADEESLWEHAAEYRRLDAARAYVFELLVPAHNGSCGPRRTFCAFVALQFLARLLRAARTVIPLASRFPRVQNRDLRRQSHPRIPGLGHPGIGPRPALTDLNCFRMRLFVGIPLPASVIDELSEITRPLRSHFTGFRWTTPDSWHITLQFLGNTNQETCDCVVSRLRALQSRAVPVRLEGFDCFARTGAFFAGVAVSPQLESLQQRVTAANRNCGFEPERRPYHPHLTLARSKREVNIEELWALTGRVSRTGFAPEFLAREFVLYESFLGRKGSQYEIRARFPLDPAEPTRSD